MNKNRVVEYTIEKSLTQLRIFGGSVGRPADEGRRRRRHFEVTRGGPMVTRSRPKGFISPAPLVRSPHTSSTCLNPLPTSSRPPTTVSPELLRALRLLELPTGTLPRAPALSNVSTGMGVGIEIDLPTPSTVTSSGRPRAS